MEFISAASQYKTLNIDGIIHSFVDRSNTDELGKYIPINYYDKDVIELDVDVPFRGGMTPLGARDASAAVYEPVFGRAKRSMETPTWKEKVRITSSELYDLRKLGTYDSLMTIRELGRQKIVLMDQRLKNRLENLRRDVLFNRRTVAMNAAGAPQEFTYPQQPVDFRPTAGVLWSTLATADPIDDLQLWAENFRRRSEFALAEVVLPYGTFRQLQQITKFQTIMNNNFGDFRGDNAAIKGMMTSFLGIGAIRESQATIGATVPVMADVAAGSSANVSLRDVYDLDVGQEVFLHRVNDSNEEIYNVVAINASTKVVTLDRVLDSDINRGDIFAWRRYTIPEDKVLLLGQPENLSLPMEGSSGQADTKFIRSWAEIASTRSMDHDILSVTSGVWRKTNIHEKADPPHIEDILGVNAIPRVSYGRGWMVAKIY